MQLVLNTFGTYISKSGDCFEIRVDDKKQEIRLTPNLLRTKSISFIKDLVEKQEFKLNSNEIKIELESHSSKLLKIKS